MQRHRLGGFFGRFRARRHSSGRSIVWQWNDLRETLRWGLHPTGIQTALAVGARSGRHAVVFTDSNTALQAIRADRDNRHLIAALKSEAARCVDTPELVWIQSHVADQAAEKGLANDIADVVTPTSTRQLAKAISLNAEGIHDAVHRANLSASDRRRETVECSKQHIKTTLNVLPRLVQKNISHLRVFGRTYDELVQNQRVYRDCDETYKERTYHYLLQCPRPTRWRERLLLHLPEERFHEHSEAMIGLILKYAGNPKLQGIEDTRCNVLNSGRIGCQMN